MNEIKNRGNRRLAREYAFQLVFGYIFTKDRDEEKLLEFAGDENLSDADKLYIADIYDGVIEKYEELMQVIASFSIGFNLHRVFKPDLAVMLLAIYEMKYVDSIPLGVSIAEGVAIVKKYSTTKSNSFVNGVLASVYKMLNEKKDGTYEREDN